METEKKPWPPMFRVVRQEKGSKDCTACVAAMALGLTMEEAKSQMQAYVLPDGSQYYKMLELFKILGAYGVIVGAYFIPDNPDGDRIAEDAHLTCDAPIQGRAHILCVKSKTQTIADHMVFYDGKAVLDPQEDEPQSISNYRILEIYPLTYFIDKGFDDEKPAAPPEGDLRAMAQTLVDNPSWDNLLCGKYGRILARHFLNTPMKPLVYDKFVKSLKDAGIEIGPVVTNTKGVDRIDLGGINIEAPVDVAPSSNVFEGETECILHRVKYYFNLGEVELADDLRLELEEVAIESIQEGILNGYLSGKLIKHEEPYLEGGWSIIKE